MPMLLFIMHYDKRTTKQRYMGPSQPWKEHAVYHWAGKLQEGGGSYIGETPLQVRHGNPKEIIRFTSGWLQ